MIRLLFILVYSLWTYTPNLNTKVDSIFEMWNEPHELTNPISQYYQTIHKSMWGFLC